MLVPILISIGFAVGFVAGALVFFRRSIHDRAFAERAIGDCESGLKLLKKLSGLNDDLEKEVNQLRQQRDAADYWKEN